MILDEFVEIKMSRTNNKYYREKGYIFNGGETILVKIEDISYGSNIKIKIVCDFCKRIFEKSVKALNTQRKNSHTKKDCCKNCVHEKNKETNLDTYGVENPMFRKDVSEKLKNTILDKYGVVSASQLDWVKEKVKNTNSLKTDEDKSAMRNKSVSTQIEKYGDIYRRTDECKEKIKRTNLERYGVDNPMKSDAVKKKAAETNLSRYGSENIFSSDWFLKYIKEYWFEKEGVDHYSKTDDFREKIKAFWDNVSDETLSQMKEKTKKTCMERYGKEFVLQLDSIRKSLRDKNGFPTSKKQQELYKIISELFIDIKENHVENPYIVDILLNINNTKIAIEYDCAYWHNPEIDERKNRYLLDKGYCLIRIKSGRLMPTKDSLLSSIHNIIFENLKYDEIYLKDWDEELYHRKRGMIT